MQLGFVGLSTMGANMVERLRDAGHDVVGYDIDPSSVTPARSASWSSSSSRPDTCGSRCRTGRRQSRP
jgi:6-phosphogluconate dehydrogenase (decarboxylating)